MVFVKILKFLHLFFLDQIGQEKVFRIVLDRKPAFLDYKNINMYGYARLCTVIYSYVQLCVAMHGYALVRTAMLGYLRLCMAM